MTPAAFDWARPNYGPIWSARVERLRRFRAASPQLQSAIRAHYAAAPWDFLNDWGVVLEPRNAALGLPTNIPLVLWPRQRELVQWIVERWRRGEPGVLLKSRDSGASWLTVALGATLCLFHAGTVVGYGSRKLEYVDGTPKSLFAKARHFLSQLPPEFLGGFTLDRHALFNRIMFPNGSAMTGEGGNQIGRGDRTSLHFLDESAFLENEAEVDAALSQATRCRIDVSTPHGRTGSFAEKFFSGKTATFVFSWRDDPRKDQAWFDKQVATLPAHVVAQEIACDFNASVEGILIPRQWIESAVDAHDKLDINVTGLEYCGFDLADTGDRCAIAMRRGILVEHLESWSGAGSDLFASTARAFSIVDAYGYGAAGFHFDADGMGSAITGDAAQLNQRRADAGKAIIRAEPYRGSAAVVDPHGELIPGHRNEDLFLNAKSQAWWWLRRKFECTYRAVVLKQPFDPDELISLPSDLPELNELMAELSWPTFRLNQAGKIVIDKHDGGRSPDRADAVVIAFQPGTGWLEIWSKL